MTVVKDDLQFQRNRSQVAKVLGGEPNVQIFK